MLLDRDTNKFSDKGIRKYLDKYQNKGIDKDITKYLD